MVVLNGSIDAKTVITFQGQLNSVRERGFGRFILDMENVKYVNSTGLGYLINLADTSGGDRAGISLVKVQPKVKVVFDMLGLNAFFKIYSSREEALKHLAPQGEAAAAQSPEPTQIMQPVRQQPAGAPAPAPPVRRPASRQMPVAPVKPASSGRIPARPRPASSGAIQPPAARPAAPAGGKVSTHVECQSCKALLAVKEVGTYKCPRCFVFFNYVGEDKVNFLPRQKMVPVQMSLNFTPECTEGLVEFVKHFAGRAGFKPQGVTEAQAAVKETVDTIKKHAYGGNDNNVYHVLLLAADSELEMRFADYGSTMNASKGDLFASARRNVDQLNIRNHPRGGNVVTLSKKAK